MVLSAFELEQLRLKLISVEEDIDKPTSRSFGRTQLHNAAIEGDLGLVKLLLSHGANPRARDTENCEPLHYANGHTYGIYTVRDGAIRTDMIRALLEAGADLEAKDIKGNTSLALAYQFGIYQSFHSLLAAGAQVHAIERESDPITGFIADILGGSDGEKAVSTALEKGADVNFVDERLFSFVGRAAWIGSPSAVLALLKSGADPNKSNNPPLSFLSRLLEHPDGEGAANALIEAGARYQFTSSDRGDDPLIRATASGSSRAVRYLIDKGTNVNHLGRSLLSALHYAADLLTDLDGLDALEALFKAGADVNVQPGYDETPLHLAAKKGSPLAVQLLLKAGADPTLRTRYTNITPLHYSANLLGHPNGAEAVSALLDAGADVTAVSADGDTPLLSAAKGGSPVAVQLLLRAKSNPMASDTRAFTPIHFAAELHQHSNGSDAVAALIQANAEVDSRSNSEEITPLCRAAKLGSPSAVLQLLHLGGNPNIPDRLGRAPLHYITSLLRHSDGPLAVAALLRKGAEANALDGSNRTPLYMAAENASPAALQLLLRAGADPNILDSARQSALSFSVDILQKPGGEDAMKALLATANPNVPDDKGKTPLYHALQKRSPVAVQLLLAAGADPNCHGADDQEPQMFLRNLLSQPNGPDAVAALLVAGWADVPEHVGIPPMHLAARFAFSSVVYGLLRKGEDPNASINGRGDRPLHFAVAAPRGPDGQDVIDALYMVGADLDAPGSGGATPLHHAARLGSLEAIQLLLARGANVNLLDEKTRSPLHYAAESSQAATIVDVISALSKAGSKLDAKDADGETPIQRALAHPSAPAAKALLEAGADVRPYPVFSVTVFANVSIY